MGKKTYRVVTFGCRTNQYESAAYQRQLEAMGYVLAPEGAPADVCVVNSCTVTATADRDSRRMVKRLAKDNPDAKIVATGCMVENLKEALPGASIIVPNKSKEALLEHLFPDQDDLPEFKIDHFPAHTRAFVKIQDGCNSYCTYCVIPYVRGRSRSRPVDEILREIEELVANGYKEIVLTGINIGDFDGSGKTLAELICEVDQISGVERLRVSSIDPDEVDDALMSAIIDGKKTCASMHIVLQAGSNIVLKRMNRKYTRQHFFEAVDRLRGARPDFTFTTDIIVGFPGETEQDFQETLDVMDEVQFAKVHMFPYSDRPRTRASQYPNKVSPDVIRERKARLLQKAERGSFALREKYVGQRMQILTESQRGGHTDNFLMVLTDMAEPNQLIDVELVRNSPKGLIGVL